MQVNHHAQHAEQGVMQKAAAAKLAETQMPAAWCRDNIPTS